MSTSNQGHPATDIRVNEGLWRGSMAPTGVLDVWLAHDGFEVPEGHAVAVVRIEDARHDLIASAGGRLEILVRANSIIEPGALVGRII